MPYKNQVVSIKHRTMKKIITFSTLLLIVLKLSAQVTINPTIELQDEYTLEVEKIEISDYNTIVYCKHTAPSTYENGGWVTFSPDTYIRDKSTYKKHKLITAEGIPLSPKKHYYQYAGQTLSFRLIFPKISNGCSSIDLIECDNSSECFNFYGIKLNKSSHSSSHTENSSNEELDKFRRDYNYVSLYNSETENWSDWEEGTNTVVFNINANGDIKIYFASRKSETFRKVTGVEEDITSGGDKYQMIGILDYEGTELLLQLFNKGDMKLIYPSGLMIQFTNSDNN
jgi:hypothetical protein